MASGNRHHIVAGDGFCLSWGAGLNGELGYGNNSENVYVIVVLEYADYTNPSLV
jgi:alpha-tubulin suppressor-like RCC1 family protein